MRLEISRESLNRALGIVGKITPLRPTTPVLSNVLIDVQQGGVNLVTTDLDSTIKTWTGAKVIEPGKTTAPVRLLSELLSTVKEEKIFLGLDKESLLLKTESVEAKVPTVSATEFPEPPEVKKTNLSKVEKKPFTESIRAVGIAASQDEGRPVLTGILLRPDGKKTVIVATDGYRLAKKEIGKVLDFEAIIPSRGITDISKVLEEDEDEVISLSISQEDNHAGFFTAHVQYFTKLIAGEFPKFEQIIPTEFVTTAVLDKESLLSSLKVASTFAKDLGNVVRLGVSDKGSTIKASSPQLGEGTVSLESEMKGQDIEIAFNKRYLNDGVNVIRGEKIEMKFAGPVNPAILKDPNDDTFLYVVMPVRTQS